MVEGYKLFDQFGKLLIGVGVFILLTGFILLAIGRISGIGRLPGDIFFQKGNFTFIFPITTSIILSILLTIILNLILRR